MSWLEGLRGALFNLNMNKLRAGLTMLGIIIGITSVIAVVTIGMGGKAAVMQEMEKTGVNLFILFSKGPTQGLAQGVVQSGQATEPLTMQDVEALKRALSQVKNLVPSSMEYANLEMNQRHVSAMVVGTTSEFAEIRQRATAKGRLFNNDETQTGREVIVIDKALADQLFGAGNPLGQQILVHNVPCRVIGVLTKDESVFAQFNVAPSGAFAYMPLGAWADIFGTQRVDQIEGTTANEADIAGTIASAKRILNQRHGTSDRFEVFNVQQLVKAANQITQILTSITGLVSGVSLLVGGIGIMNIMLVSVTERTREIGLRKALGARERDILLQFLMEAMVISLIGGLIGILLGSGSALLIANLLKWPLILSGWAIILAAGFSVAVGLFFGYYPAWKAAKLEPMIALRHE
jgi:putative ABC transport system permease protein